MTTEVSNRRVDITTVMVMIPMEEEQLRRLKSIFTTVYYHPNFFKCAAYGRNDDEKSKIEFESVNLQEWKSIELLILAGIPSQLYNRLQQTPNLKWIQIFSAGSEWIFKSKFIKNEPKDSNLLLTNAAGVHSLSISQHVFMLVLALYHFLPDFILSQMVDQNWNRNPRSVDNFTIRNLRGEKIGIIGYGAIGREVGRVAKAWGMEVLACTSDGQRKEETSFMLEGTGDPDGSLPSKWYATSNENSLKDFLSECDIVVISAPSSPMTLHIINSKTLSYMKKTSILINISRGDLVDQDALIEALNSGLIGGAGIDVATPEPLPPHHPLFSAKNCIVTPHISGHTINYTRTIVDIVLANTERIKLGDWPYNRVRLDRGY